uniref:Uncharacterized protein n=1 Tax=Hemiselmis andersenii TaxID=464988 RepID=A0A7S0TUA7_HEMAN
MSVCLQTVTSWIPEESQRQCAEAGATALDEILQMRGGSMDAETSAMLVKDAVFAGGRSDPNTLVTRAIVSAIFELAKKSVCDVMESLCCEEVECMDKPRGPNMAAARAFILLLVRRIVSDPSPVGVEAVEVLCRLATREDRR